MDVDGDARERTPTVDREGVLDDDVGGRPAIRLDRRRRRQVLDTCDDNGLWSLAEAEAPPERIPNVILRLRRTSLWSFWGTVPCRDVLVGTGEWSSSPRRLVSLPPAVGPQCVVQSTEGLSPKDIRP